MLNQNNSEPVEWAANCFAWSLLDNKNVSVLRERMGQNTKEQLHMHTISTQLFYILEGEAHYK